MVSITAIVVTTAIITILGFGIGWGAWLITRPKKMSWGALVYQLSDGVKPPRKDKYGKVIDSVPLSDLRPYTRDVVVREQKGSGNVSFTLVKLGKAVPAVTSDCVDFWGPKDKFVSVLLEGDSATLLKKGYSRSSGVIFEPMPHDRMNLIKTEMELARERTKEAKDVLASITPWILAGIAFLGLFGMTYLVVQGFIEITDKVVGAEENLAAAQVKAAELYRDAARGEFGPDVIAKREDAPEVIPP